MELKYNLFSALGQFSISSINNFARLYFEEPKNSSLTIIFTFINLKFKYINLSLSFDDVGWLSHSFREILLSIQNRTNFEEFLNFWCFIGRTKELLGQATVNT